METIKINVEVNVNLSESTQKFLTSLLSSPTLIPAAPAVPAQPVQTKPAAPAQPAQPAQTKPAAPAAPSAPAAPAASSATKSIEDVRKMLSEKVNTHREVIKQKLNEFGAPSVTKLDPSKYDEMYNFLASLQ